jgi:siderophore synthetase component
MRQTTEIQDLSGSGESDLNAVFHSDQFIEVRRRIFRQLIESLLYERIIKAEIETIEGSSLFRLHGQDEAGHPITYLCWGQRRFSFERIRLLRTPVIRMAGEETLEATSFSRLLWEIRLCLGVDTERLRQFAEELEQTLLKDSISQFYRHKGGYVLRGRSYDVVESGLADGHPYHPSYKSRLGFNYLDNQAFGHEFSPTIQPLWLAVHREWTHRAFSQAINPTSFLRHELGEAIYCHFYQRIRDRGYCPEHYYPLPVHPWQWREQIVPSFYQQMSDDRLLLLGVGEDSYHPQQSIRTLANISAPHKAYLKLSLSIVNTSTSRILASHTVRNAPLISDWLKGILQRDLFSQKKLGLILLGEVLGITYDPPQSVLKQRTAYGVLACIWRESLHPFLLPGEQAVPFNALCHCDLDGLPFIDPWVRQVGLERWLQQLLEVSILPIIHWLYAHGIAFEAHAQNMILIHQQGIPHRIALKDFHDGIRFSPSHLSNSQQRPKLHSTPASHQAVNRNSYLETDNLEDVRDFMLDAFFFINLSELALFLVEHFDFDESYFWSLARTVIIDYQTRFPQLQERFALFDLLTPTIEVEQLTKRRLFPEIERRVHQVPNALAWPETADRGAFKYAKTE